MTAIERRWSLYSPLNQGLDRAVLMTASEDSAVELFSTLPMA